MHLDNSLTPSNTSTHASSSDASKSNKRPAAADVIEIEDEGKNEGHSSGKKAKQSTEHIFCLACNERLNPVHTQCFHCGRDPRVLPVFAGASSLGSFGSNSFGNSFATPGFPFAVSAPIPFPSLAAPTPSPAASSSSSATPAPTPGATVNAGLVGQAWSSQGRYLPVAAEAVEALRSGEYKEISHYLPKRSTLFEADNKDNLDLRFDNGKLTLKQQSSTRRVNSFADLETAHHQGLVPLLVSFQDFHRHTQYGLLWNIVRDMIDNKCPFQIVLQHYETTRQTNPGLLDNVGGFHPTILAQTQLALTSLALSASNASIGKSSNSAFRSPSSSSSGSARVKVCMPFNDLKCTSDSCGLPHKCCRCFQAHAANSGECSMPDPRDATSGGSGPRGRRGGGGASKYKGMGSGRKTGAGGSSTVG